MHCVDYDYFIVGQGLAGSVLAHQLIAQGLRVCVIDKQHQGSASLIAAGIINPITGHRLNITDGFSEYFRTAKQCYAQLEKDLQQRFFHTIDQQRLIKNLGQLDYYQQRQQQLEYQYFLSSSKLADDTYFKHPAHGVAQIKQSAHVDTPTLLSAAKQWLISQNAYQSLNLDYSEISFRDNHVSIADKSANAIIFCEGYQAIHNPWLQQLPFKLAKGEILTIESEQNIPPLLLNWGQWLLSTNDNTLRMGSNYLWQEFNDQINPDSATQFLNSLTNNTNVTAHILQHKAGVRPTTKYRQAFVGRLSAQTNAYCFNGFGSKGCLLIPYYAAQLTLHLTQQKPLSPELTKWL